MDRPKIRFRPLDGILLLDKPAGMSSNAALQVARRLFRAEKGGHTGSLDPLATGLLPLCFGEATKLAGLLLGSDKAYEAGVVLGATTDTDDADGKVLLQRPVPRLDRAALEAVLARFTGTLQQRAPVYSALKQGGEPLYARARRGEVIEAPVREVVVRSIELLDCDAGQLRLRVTCGSGTYIRSLARDLGEVLGCGAHIASLRRLWVDPFRQPQMHTLAAPGGSGRRGWRDRAGGLHAAAGRRACRLPQGRTRIGRGLAVWPGPAPAGPVATGRPCRRLHIGRNPAGPGLRRPGWPPFPAAPVPQRDRA